MDGRSLDRRAAALVAALAIAVGLTVAPLSAQVARAVTTAIEDSYTVDEDQTLVVDAPGVLANDTSDEGPLCVTGTVGAELEGSVDGVNEDGSFSYTPPSDFNGTTSFGYSVALLVDGVCTGEPLANTTPTVTITVAPVNDPPTAKADSFQGLAGRTLTVTAPGILRNDDDVDADALVALKVTNPTHGTVNVAPDGGFSYMPAAGYLGPDGFSYRASDGSETSAVRVVSITVTAVPTPAPSASPAPRPTAPPSATPHPSAAPSDGGSVPPEETASTAPGGSAGASPSPAASLAPGRPAADAGGLSIPVLVLGLLLASLLAFGGAFLLPKWLEQRRAVGHADDGFADDGFADDGDPRDDQDPR